MEHDIALKMTLRAANPGQFVRDLQDLLSRNSQNLMINANSDFDKINMLRNKKRFTLFLSDEGQLLRNVDKSKGNVFFQNEVFPKMVELVLSCATCNFVHGDLSPTSIFYSETEEFQNPLEDEDEQASGQKGFNASTSVFQKIKPTRRIRHKMNSCLRDDPEAGLGNLFQHSFEDSLRESLPQSKVTSQMLLSSRHREFLVGEIKKKVQLKLTSLGQGKILDFKKFAAQQRQALLKYSEIRNRSQIRVEFSPIDKYFDFAEELKKEVNISISDQENVESQFMTRSYLRDNNFLFRKSREAVPQKRRVGPASGGRLHISKSIVNSEACSNEFELIDPEREGSYSFSDNLHKFFFESSFFKKKSKLDKQQIKEIEALSAKIKKRPIKGHQKYAGILSFLKVDGYFLGDFESVFYSVLDIMSLLPRSPATRADRASSFMFNSQIKSNRPSEEKEIENITSFQAKITFMTGTQIEILLSVLASISETDFPEHESAINMLFGFQKKSVQVHRKLPRSRHSPATGKSPVKGYGEVDRFRRLRSLLLRINEQRQDKIFEFFNLRFEKSRNLLVKLSMENSEEFSQLPTKMRVYYQLFKKWFFHYLVFLMLSKQYHFIHKFCVLLMLKSSV